MSFAKFEPRYIRHTPYLRIYKSYMSLSDAGLEKLGNPERVSIWYDKNDGAIKLVADACGHKISQARKQNCIHAKISHFMPTGRYFWKEDNLFKLATL